MRHLSLLLLLALVACSSITHSGLNNVDLDNVEIKNKGDVVKYFGLPDKVIKVEGQEFSEILTYNREVTSTSYFVPTPSASYNISDYVNIINVDNQKKLESADLIFYLNSNGEVVKHVKK